MKPITDTLREYRKGELVNAASEQLAEVTKAVTETGKSGKLVITLTVKPNEHDQIFMEAELKKTIPQPSLPAAIFFVDDDGGLHRSDPRQREMPFSDTKPKEVASQ